MTADDVCQQHGPHSGWTCPTCKAQRDGIVWLERLTADGYADLALAFALLGVGRAHGSSDQATRG